MGLFDARFNVSPLFGSVEDTGTGLDPATADRIFDLLHDEAQRHGRGALDLPIDRRRPWRALLGVAACAVRHRLDSSRRALRIGRRVDPAIAEGLHADI